MPELLSNHEVVPVDRKDGNLEEREVIDGLIEDTYPDVVIHLAAKYGRVLGEVDPTYTVEQNALVTTNVAKACQNSGTRLLYVSSSEAYGDRGYDPITEDSLYRRLPHNIYGLSKRWGEEVCRLYVPDVQICRLNMPYGPGQAHGHGRCALMNMLWQAHERKPIPVHRGAERSWCWVGDEVRAIRMVMEHGQAGVWNVGRDDARVTMLQVATIACALADAPDLLITRVDPPKNQTLVKRLDMSRLRALGWAPTLNLLEGMTKTYEWIREPVPA